MDGLVGMVRMIGMVHTRDGGGVSGLVVGVSFVGLWRRGFIGWDGEFLGWW